MEAIVAVSNAAIRNGMFHFEQRALGDIERLLHNCQGVRLTLNSPVLFYFLSLIQKRCLNVGLLYGTEIIVFLPGI